MDTCEFCNREFKGLGIHRITCAKNPNKNKKYLQYKSDRQTGKPGRVWTEQQRRNHSKAMLKAVQEHPDSYKGRWRKYSVEYNGEVYDSGWEVLARKYFDKHYITASRKIKARLEYTYAGSVRTYTPDFYLPRLKIYVEVKGGNHP